jgi:preprotein translocase subunit SecD
MPSARQASSRSWMCLGVDEFGEPILGEVLLTGDVITSASIGTNPTTNEIEVNVSFNAEGTREWAEITGARIGQQIAIVLDGNVESAPVVRDRITGGETSISGNFTPKRPGVSEPFSRPALFRCPSSSPSRAS